VTDAGDLPARDGLARRLGVWGATAIVVGNVIGSGIFVAPGEVARVLGHPGACLVAWALGGLVTLAGALAFAELGAAYPETGGQYVFLRRAFGARVAFAFGWAELWIIKPTGAAGIAVVFAQYAHAAWPALPVRATAIAALAAVYAVNYRSLAASSQTQLVLTVVKAAGLVVLGAVALRLAGAPPATPVPPVAALGPAAWAAALVPILWTFDGWSDVTYVAGEVRSPQRVLPRALLGGTVFVTLLYLGVVWAVQAALDPAVLAPGTPVLALVAERAWGAAGAGTVTALVLAATFGSLLAGAITTPRIFFAMARDKLFFARLGRPHPRYRTPSAAIVTIAAAAIAYVAAGTFAQIITYFVFVMWLFYALTGVALFVLRRRDPTAARPFRTPAYPWAPALFVAVSLAMLAGVAGSSPRETAIGSVLVLSGLPAYDAWRRWRRRQSRA
jgi:APA family basic amino acid/polyamine antiporter